MKKNNKLIIGVVAVLAVVGLVFFMTGGKITTDENGVPGFTYKCFNVDHVEVSCSTGNPLSVVQGVPGIGFLQFTVSAVNTGDIPLTCDVLSSSPTAFSSALVTGAKIVDVGGQASWTSGDVELAPLEALSQPVSFTSTIRCKYRNGVNTVTISPDVTKQVDLTITSDVINAGFDVTFNEPNVGTVVCGDGTCQVPTENVVNCAVDCSV